MNYCKYVRDQTLLEQELSLSIRNTLKIQIMVRQYLKEQGPKHVNNLRASIFEVIFRDFNWKILTNILAIEVFINALISNQMI